MAQGISWQNCREGFDMTILHAAAVNQGGFGAAEGPSQQLSVLRGAAGFDLVIFTG